MWGEEFRARAAVRGWTDGLMDNVVRHRPVQ
jgi:hypothetical protein